MATKSPEVDVARAQQIWAEYQKHHDVSDRKGQAVGIDPVSGRIWFGESLVDISKQMDAEGIDVPVYLVRVGYDYYIARAAISDSGHGKGRATLVTKMTEIFRKRSVFFYLRRQKVLWASDGELAGADLSGLDLRRADLRKRNLRNARLRQTRLGGADLRNALLDGADLAESDLFGLFSANLEGASLTHVSFQGAFLERVNFQKADLSFADLSRSTLRGADFRGACLTNANFSEADIVVVKGITRFDNANLQQADFTGARLMNVSFRGADLRRALFSVPGARVTKGTVNPGLHFKGAIWDSTTRFPKGFDPKKSP